MYFNYDFDLIFLYKHSIRLWTGEVKHYEGLINTKIYDKNFVQKFRNTEVVSKNLTS